MLDLAGQCQWAELEAGGQILVFDEWREDHLGAGQIIVPSGCSSPATGPNP